MLKSFTIEDELSMAPHGGIEVLVELHNREKRWCFFMTPQALTHCGDWITGTNVSIHFGAPHMIVVSQIDEHIIAQALHHIDRQGKLETCTLAYNQQ